MSGGVGIQINVSASELKTLIKTLGASDKAARQAKDGTRTFTGSLAKMGDDLIHSAGHMTRLHHSLRLLHQLTRLAQEAFGPFGEAIKKAFEFRFDADPAKIAVDRLMRSFGVMQARIGDLFVPLIVGMSRALKPVIDDIARWTEKNEKLVGGKIIEWASGFAVVLVSGIATGANLANKAIGGLSMVTNLLASAKHRLSAAILGGAEASAKEKGLSEAYRKQLVERTKQEEAAADVAEASAARAMKDMEDNEKRIDSFALALQGAIEKGRSFGKDFVDSGKKANQATKAMDEAMRASKFADGIEAIKNKMKELAKDGDFTGMGPIMEKMGNDLARGLGGPDLQANIIKVKEAVHGLSEETRHMVWGELGKKISLASTESEIEKLRVMLNNAPKGMEFEWEEADKALSSKENEFTAFVLGQWDKRVQAVKGYQDAVGRATEAEFAQAEKLEQEKVAEILKLNDGTAGSLERMWAAYEVRRASLGKHATNEIMQEFDKLNREKAKEMAKTIESHMTAAIDIVNGAFEGLGQRIDGHVKTIGDAMRDMFGSLGRMILDTASKWVVAKGIEMAADKIATAASITASRAKATAEIQANAAVAASGAASSQAGIPIVGPLLAGAAAIAMFALVAAYAGKFHQGGIVPGSGDRMILAQGGEMVLPRDQVMSALAAGYGPRGGGSGRGAAPPSGGGHTTVVQKTTKTDVRFFAPLSQAQFDRMHRDYTVRAQNRMEAFGYTGVVGR